MKTVSKSILAITLLMIIMPLVQAGVAVSVAASSAAIASANNARTQAEIDADNQMITSSGLVPVDYSIEKGCSIKHDRFKPLNVFDCTYGNLSIDYITVNGNGEVISVVHREPYINSKYITITLITLPFLISAIFVTWFLLRGLKNF